MLQDLVGTVLIDVGTFLFIYVQADSGEFAGADSFDQIVGLNQRAAGSVDQKDAVLHLLDRIMVDQMIGIVHQRAVQGDQVALCQQFVQRHIGDEILQVRILEYVVSQDLHAESAADPCHGRADLAGADDAGGFLIEIKAHQSVQAEVVLTDSYVGLVQSAVDGELSLLGRLHSWSEAKNAVLLAREQGVDNISCDLMLGTPGQTLESLALSVSRLLELKVPHISAYMLKIEENTPFDCDGIKDLAAGEDLVCDMYLSLCRTLRDSGYSRYEISNFSLPGYFSRHNLKYWTLKEYLGIGPSAHSFIGGRRLYIPSDVAGFINNPVSEDLVEDDNINMLEEYIMLSLRLDSGASYQKIASLGGDAGRVRHKAEIFSQNGLIKLNDSSFSLTDRGALVSNNLILEIYLAAIDEDV